MLYVGFGGRLALVAVVILWGRYEKQVPVIDVLLHFYLCRSLRAGTLSSLVYSGRKRSNRFL